MNKEVKLLRGALQRLLDAMRETADEDTMSMGHADFVLKVTSGELPPGYAMTQDPITHRYHMSKDGAAFRWFYDEFEARLFCWQHFEDGAHV